MAKIKNDRSQYTRRSDLIAGPQAKLSGSHRKPNPDRAKQIAKKLTVLKREFVEF